jgi:hypothetical protein
VNPEEGAMSRTRIFTLGISVLTLALGLGWRLALGQPSPPTENKGVSVDKTESVDLGPEIAGMQGRLLRVRVVTVQAGGQIRQHSHADWPEVVYVTQGVVTEHRGARRRTIARGRRSGATMTRPTGSSRADRVGRLQAAVTGLFRKLATTGRWPHEATGLLQPLEVGGWRTTVTTSTRRLATR